MDLVSLNLLFLENRSFAKGALVKALSTRPGGSTGNVHTEIGTELEQPFNLSHGAHMLQTLLWCTLY
jgi:hypothetical protein